MDISAGRQGISCSVHGILKSSEASWDIVGVDLLVRDHLREFHPRVEHKRREAVRKLMRPVV